ncbi:hypothetical protein Pla163_25880 [Planctomycetes bacterium Pla163]|uniref:NfeD-like C-terminal domain-containing protein n=1 Tax=Rohdeia mirabilis TaxID=2528008 RepID=A0A518D1V1_9BACT|nr:hypothetical protein Pla163_25880 [Planctomycetes bacterium Pla163]
MPSLRIILRSLVLGLAFLVAASALASPTVPAASAQGQGRTPGTGGATGADAARTGPVVVRLAGELNASSLSLLRRAIDAARPAGRIVIVELDTPGGEVTLMWRLAKAIDAAREDGTVVVALVDAKALSAGSMVAMSCEEIYMTPEAVIGAATPITIGMQGIEKAEEKFLSSFRVEWRAWAERNNRPPALAEGMVDETVEVRLVEIDGLPTLVTGTEWDDLRETGANVTLVRTVVDDQTLVALTASEALEFGFSEGTVSGLRELVELNLGQAFADVERIQATASEELVARLAPIAPFLLVIAVLLALAEFQAPGFGVAGIGSLVCFALLLASRYLTGLAGWEHVVAMGLGVVLIAVELLIVPGTFVAGISGGLLLLWGLVASQLGPGFDWDLALDRRVLIGATISTLGWTLVGMFGGLALGRILPRTPVGHALASGPSETGTGGFASAVGELACVGADALRPGALGTCATALRPVGRVLLDGHSRAEVEASVDGGSLDVGTRVRVVVVRTGRIVVEAVEPDDGGTGA